MKKSYNFTPEQAVEISRFGKEQRRIGKNELRAQLKEKILKRKVERNNSFSTGFFVPEEYWEADYRDEEDDWVLKVLDESETE